MIDEASTDGATGATAETLILVALGERPGRTIGELADDTALQPMVVRAILRLLCRHGIAWRAITGPNAGRWRLTTLGQAEADDSRHAQART